MLIFEKYIEDYGSMGRNLKLLEITYDGPSHSSPTVTVNMDLVLHFLAYSFYYINQSGGFKEGKLTFLQDDKVTLLTGSEAVTNCYRQCSRSRAVKEG